MGDKFTAFKKTKQFKWSLRIAIVLVIYTLVGFFLVPAIIKWQMLKQLPGITKRQPAIEQVRFNPYVLSLTIRGFSLKESNGEVFASFDEFYANFQMWMSLFKWSWVFDEISLKKPFAQATYQPDGNFNFANLLTNGAPAETKSTASKSLGLPSVLIYRLLVTNGVVAFADLDRKETFHTAFEPIDLNLTEFTTIRDRNSPYRFIARTGDGETFGWSGTVSINPLRSEGKFRIGNLPLKKYSTYGHDYARFEIASGLLDVGADYRYDSLTNALDLTVSNAVAYLRNFELKSPDTGESLLNIPALSVSNAEANAARMSVRVGLITSSGGSVLARQEHDGSINLLSLFNLPAAKPAATAKSSLPPLTAKIDEIAFDNCTIKAEDKKPEQAASFTMDQLAFDLKDVSNASNAPVTLAALLRFQQSGFIGVNGTATLLPPSADLQLALTNVDLRAIQPYVHEQVKLAITSGGLNLHGHARYASPEANPPLLRFTGNLSITNFATADDVLFKDFAKWDALDVDGINVQLKPDKLHADQVKFTGLNTSLVVGPDRRANLQTILREQIAAKTNAALASAKTGANPAYMSTPLPDISLGALLLLNASIHFDDQSIEPHCTFDVQEFSGSVKGLSSKEDSTAVVNMNGKVDARSPFGVSGKVNPLSKFIFADLVVTFTNTELTAFTPYTEKYAGRPLQKGKLSFAVHYLVQKNALKAENGFYVDQLTLGPKNDSPDATHLPVGLAIKLLKDRHGRITLDVPVTGRIDDPKFKYGPIVWHVVMNLVEKAAASPFSLLGSMFGGGEELSFVAFEPGKAAVPDTETNKLNTLIKALYERPELTMELNGSVDPELDRPLLAQMKFEQQIKTLWVKELTDSGKPAIAVDQVQLEPKQRERLIKRDYKILMGKYQPTPPPTNNLSPEQLAAAQKADKERLFLKSSDTDREHGAALLMQSAVLAKPPELPKAAPGAAKPAKPLSRAETEIADMEAQLVKKTEVTDDDLRELMKQRATKVQAYLLQDGRIKAERLFITAPRPIGGATKGMDRVNMTLD